MKAVNPYLNFPGTAEEAFALYRSVFGGEFSVLQRFADVPGCGDLPAADRGKIMHIALPLKNGSLLMASDAVESMGHKLVMGNHAYVSIETDSEAESLALFNGLSVGGTVEMAPQKMFWGAFFGSWKDRFGIGWMVNHTYPKSF